MALEFLDGFVIEETEENAEGLFLKDSWFLVEEEVVKGFLAYI